MRCGSIHLLFVAGLLGVPVASVAEPADPPAAPVDASRGDAFFSPTHRSPGLAAALSLNPLPIDSHGGGDCGDWSDLERGLMFGLAGGYLAVKVVAALHAASAARDFNASHGTVGFWVSPAPGPAGRTNTATPHAPRFAANCETPA